MYKTHQHRTTFGSCGVENVHAVVVHAVVVQSKFPSQKIQNTPCSDAGPRLKVEMSKKCTPLWLEAHFQVQVKMFKNTTCSDLRTFRCRFAWQAQGIVHLVKSEQNVRVLSHFQKRWQAWDIRIRRGSAKMHLPLQAQYHRHVHQRC